MAASKAALHKTSLLFGGFNAKSLHGVCQDEDQEHVLVTFRSFVKRFNIVDRQQVKNWTTKSWNPFTCAAVYDKEERRVVGVVSDNVMVMWSLENEDLDSSNRSKFQTPISRLVTCGNSVYVVFTSGHMERLSASLLASRKNPKTGFLTAEETITYVEVIEDAGLVVMVVEGKDNKPTIYKLALEESMSQPQDSHTLTHNNATLTGICATSSAKLLTLWSTGEVYLFEFQNEYLEKLPGRLHAKEHQVNVSKPTKILELSPAHVAIIGQDKDDEGGLIILRDIKFGLVTSTQPLKIYHRPPPAWVTPIGLVVMEGGSLALIPYTVQGSNLASIFRSGVSEAKNPHSEVCHGWMGIEDEQEDVPKEANKTIYSNKSAELAKVMETVNKGAMSESVMAPEVINVLIEKRKLNLLREGMNVFVDVPETSLVDVLNFYLSCKDSEFEGLCDAPQFDLEFTPPEEEGEKIVCPFKPSKAYFINLVLKRSFSDVYLLTALPKMSFDHSLSLIKYLHFLISAGQVELVPPADAPSLKQIVLWLSLLLDINYHQLVMSSEVSIHRLLLSCFTQVSAVIKFLEGMSDVELLARRIVEGQPLSTHTHSSAPYSLELLVIP